MEPETFTPQSPSPLTKLPHYLRVRGVFGDNARQVRYVEDVFGEVQPQGTLDLHGILKFRSHYGDQYFDLILTKGAEDQTLVETFALEVPGRERYSGPLHAISNTQFRRSRAPQRTCAYQLKVAGSGGFMFHVTQEERSLVEALHVYAVESLLGRKAADPQKVQTEMHAILKESGITYRAT